MKTRLVGAAVLMIGVASAVTAYVYWKSTPAYSLRQAKHAVDSHDVGTFEKYVDVESISSRLIDDMMARTMEDAQGNGSAHALGATLASGLMQLVKPRLVQMVREQTERFVETGSLQESAQRATSDSSDVSLETIARNLGAAPADFRRVAYVRRRSNIALVGFSFENTRLDTVFVLQMKMRKMGNYWRLVELSNAGQLLQEMENLECRRLAQFNGPILQDISRTIEVARVQKRSRSDSWGISKYVDLQLSTRNRSAKSVRSYNAAVSVLDPDGKVIKTLQIRDDDSIAPEGSGGGVWTFDINMFDDSDQRFYDLSSEDAAFETVIEQVVFDDGTELRVFKSLDKARSSTTGGLTNP